MIERLQDRPKSERIGSGGAKGEALRYRVELRDQTNPNAVERVLARAFNAALARAIFKAAKTEHPGRRILLCRGALIVADSAK
jgi:hypothetical protein